MNEKRGRKLLVIDDDSTACGVLEAALSPRGFEIVTVSDPATALEKAREISPVLIFISLLLPGTNGLKVSKSLHSTEGLEDIPVLMMISHVGELDPKYTTTIGIVDVVVKPLNSEEVLGKVLNILGIAPETSPLSSEDESPFAYSLKDDEDVAEAIAFPDESPASESGADQASPTKKADMPQEETGLFADIAEEGKDFEAYPEMPSGHEEEQAQEFAYDDEYDSYKNTEKQTTKKIILLASSLFIIVLLGIGVFFMKDSLFSSKKAAPPAVVQQLQPDIKVSSEPAVTRPQEALLQVKTETASLPAVTAGREMPPKAASEKAPKEPVEKQPALPAEPPKQPAVRTGKPASEKTERIQSSPVKKPFTVQVGVFENKKNADSLAEKLKKQGYAAVVLKDTGKNRKPLYRVTAGSFDSRSKADQQSRTLFEKEGIKSIVR